MARGKEGGYSRLGQQTILNAVNSGIVKSVIVIQGQSSRGQCTTAVEKLSVIYGKESNENNNRVSQLLYFVTRRSRT